MTVHVYFAVARKKSRGVFFSSWISEKDNSLMLLQAKCWVVSFAHTQCTRYIAMRRDAPWCRCMRRIVTGRRRLSRGNYSLHKTKDAQYDIPRVSYVYVTLHISSTSCIWWYKAISGCTNWNVQCVQCEYNLYFCLCVFLILLTSRDIINELKKNNIHILVLIAKIHIFFHNITFSFENSHKLFFLIIYILLLFLSEKAI